VSEGDVKSLICRAFSIIVSLIVASVAILAIGHFARVEAQQQSYTVLYNFQGGTSGAYPYGGLLLDSAGDLFGTTDDTAGGATGIVFELSASGSFNVLHVFLSKPNDGHSPKAGVISDRAGNLFGTTFAGGRSNAGTIFGLSPAGKEAVLHPFAGSPSDGSFPTAPLLAGSGGLYYGTTIEGGTFNLGTVFEFNITTRLLTILHSFGGTGDGNEPNGGLITDSSGNLYGTTAWGGANNCGTLFELTAAGVETVLHSFTGTDGCNPYGSLLRNTAGDLYTTTFNGGANNLGAIVKWSENGKEFVLYSFGGPDGSGPFAPLIRDSSGDFYGTTYNGGANGLGVAFEFSNAQQYTVLHSFTGGTTDGANPYAPLVRDSSGNLYGATVDGGNPNCTNGCGTIFKITP